jgi:hypothetical protein
VNDDADAFGSWIAERWSDDVDLIRAVSAGLEASGWPRHAAAEAARRAVERWSAGAGDVSPAVRKLARGATAPQPEVVPGVVDVGKWLEARGWT